MPKKKNHLWIEVKETISRNIGLEIGVDISQEDADSLIALAEDNDEFKRDSKGYAELDNYLGTNISDTEGFTDVQVYIKPS